MTDDLPAYVAHWLREHASMPIDDLARALDADLRQQFGGGEVYIHRRPKAERLRRLADLPPEASARQIAAALGVSPTHATRLRRLARD